MTEFLTKNGALLLNYGGHAAAAGFSIDKDKVDEFIQTAEEQTSTMIKDEDLVKTFETDIKLPLAKATRKLAELTEQLQPFGIGNPKPVFYSEAEIIAVTLMGKKNEHLKIYVKDPDKQSFPIEMVVFSGAPHFPKLTRGQRVPLVYELEINHWGGTEKLTGKVKLIESSTD
jgi:single-stranded-DNA-specific exonuclease